MSATCDICGKGVLMGKHVPHSKHRTKKPFKPNLQNHTFVVNGVSKKLKVCTRCLITVA